jgi:hypothetical protein
LMMGAYMMANGYSMVLLRSWWATYCFTVIDSGCGDRVGALLCRTRRAKWPGAVR